MAGKKGNNVLRKSLWGPSFSFNRILWGNLQHHICLVEDVYARLPFEAFFNLRTVCKEWYNFACKRLALKEPIHQPVFALYTRCSFSECLKGFLSYKASMNSWRWRVTHTHEMLDDVALDAGCELVSRSSDQCVWCLDYTGRCSELPLMLIPENEKTILGVMRVGPKTSAEKCLNVYTDYKVVRGGQGFDTQIYDSRTRKWETKPCRPKPATGLEMEVSIGSVDCNGRVYITSEHTREIFVYNFEAASWSSLESPCHWISDLPQHYCLDTLGTWNGRVFDVAADSRPSISGNSQPGSLCVWELLDGANMKPEWRVYGRLPRSFFSWLRSDQGFPRLIPRATKSANVSIQASFSGDYLVVYSWDFQSGMSARFCLFNMATKNWQKLAGPSGRLQGHRDYWEFDDSDSDSD